MKYETQMRLASNLKRLRTSREMSQAELANKLEMDRSLLAMYESGRRCPDPGMLYEFAKFFGLPMETLLETDPERIVSEAAYEEVCEKSERRLLDLYRLLTPFSRGRLLEKAEDLAVWDAFRMRQQKVFEESAPR